MANAVLGKGLQQQIVEAADQFDLPETLLVAWSCAMTYWDPAATHYDPNYDRMRVAGNPTLWSLHPDWITDGPTCEEFFLFHPERKDDWQTGRNYEFVAQTTIASGYGPFLLRYPTALQYGYTGEPQDLASVEEGTRWAAAALRGELEAAESLGRTGKASLAFAVMSVGSIVPSRRRVQALEDAHREIYGAGFFVD